MSGFPVRCLVRHTYLGEEADPLAKVLDKSGTQLSRAIIEAVVKQCAFSLSINIGLMFVPVMGQAIAGLMAVMQMISGKKYEKDTQQIIQETSEEIKKRAELSSVEVKAAAEVVYAQELPAAQALAMSGQSLDGFGSSFKKAVSRVGSSIRKVGSAFDDAVHRLGSKVADELARAEDKVKEAARNLEDQAKVIAKDPDAQLKFLTTMSPIGLARLGIKYTANTVVSAAKQLEKANIVGKGDLTDPLRDAREHVDENMYTAQRLTSPITGAQEGARLTAKHGGELTAKVLEAVGQKAAAEDVRKVSGGVSQYAYELQKAVTPIGFYNLGSGRETYLAAKEACAKMKAAAFKEIDTQRIAAIKKFQSPEGRLEMRKSIARYLREDPAFIAHMEAIRRLEEEEAAEYAKLLAQEQAANAVLAQNAQPSTTTSGAGAFVGVAAAIAAALTLSR